jgi:hypothetical protein
LSCIQIGYDEELTELFVIVARVSHKSKLVLRNIANSVLEVESLQGVKENSLAVEAHAFLVLVFNTTVVLYEHLPAEDG